jgi:GNAT superfamily N-acetyltransferase
MPAEERLEVATDECRALEEAGLNAWPATQQMLYDGWLLRFAGGYTKRANSVNALYPSRLGVADKVAFCEAIYAAQGLPAIFRLTPLAPAGLDAHLAGCGYAPLDPTLVLWRRMDTPLPHPAGPGSLQALPRDEWARLQAALGGFSQPSPYHLAILRAMVPECCFGAWLVEGELVACGLLVRQGDYAGLFDIVTAPAHRRLGYGRALVAALLTRAAESGARTAYLQVVEGNAPARALYEELGYTVAYRYWYRAPQR